MTPATLRIHTYTVTRNMASPTTLRSRTYTATRNTASHLHTDGHIVSANHPSHFHFSQLFPFTTVLYLSHVIARRSTVSASWRRRHAELFEQPRVHGDCDFQNQPVFPHCLVQDLPEQSEQHVDAQHFTCISVPLQIFTSQVLRASFSITSSHKTAPCHSPMASHAGKLSYTATKSFVSTGPLSLPTPALLCNISAVMMPSPALKP